MTIPYNPRVISDKELERRHRLTKLTKEQQLEARRLYQTQIPKPTVERLAQIYHVAPSTLWRVLNKPFQSIK